MLFQVGPDAVTYSEAMQQKKKVAIICKSMPKCNRRKRWQ